MMVAARAPDLIQCVAGLSGLYDLEAFAKSSDAADTAYGLSYISRVIGTDRGEWGANSPVNQAGKIKAPVFMAHGEIDERTPFAQAVDEGRARTGRSRTRMDARAGRGARLLQGREQRRLLQTPGGIPGAEHRALRLPVRARVGIHHPWHPEPVDHAAVTRRPEDLGEVHHHLAALLQRVEPAAGLGDVVGMQGDIEAVLGLVDVGRPLFVHVRAHQRLVADLEPAMHQPVLELRVDWHVRRSVAVGKCGGDPAAQDFRVEVECLAALAVETQAGHDFPYECFPTW